MIKTKRINIALFGEPGTGKTSLLSRITKNHFNPQYDPTIGINYKNHTLLVADQNVDIVIWDITGLQKYRLLENGLHHDMDGILMVYDVSKPATFEDVRLWLGFIDESVSSKMVIKLVGNKNDLQSKVPREIAEQFAVDNGLSYIETSALTDDNVHLAFKSMAQEINAATHSLAPLARLTFSDDDQQAFQVVLVDIKQAAYDKKIVCVEKPLDEPNLEFIAISYRWGEVHEQTIDTRLGYMTSVTSFALKDFYRLCSEMTREVDLQSIKYVWVDAICVDQNNHARRKATIYQMSNIYHRAAYILAVPDLHSEYLKNNRIFDGKLVSNTHKFKEYIYCLLQKKTDQLGQITENWFDEMNIPKGTARKKLTERDVSRQRFTNYLGACNVQVADNVCQDECSHNCYTLSDRDCHATPKVLLDYIQYSINYCHSHFENTTNIYENSDCALCSLQMGMCKLQKSPNKNQVIPSSDQKWLACVLREFQYDKYRSLVTEQSQDIVEIMDYLQYLIKDWSSRVWVISECNIVKTKPSRKLKFWFLSLQIFSLDDVKMDEKLRFYAFDFDKNEILLTQNLSLDDITFHAYYSYNDFQITLRSQLNERSFLQMMLNSKASRNEDRFYAILPSSEYKVMLTSREVVSSWQIDTMVSVKLKLFELMTIKDKLDLLYWLAYSSLKSYCTFPAFANINMETHRVPSIEKPNEKKHPCNFDLNNNATLWLVPPMDNGFPFHKLNLSPKMYYVIRPDGNSYAKQIFFDDNHRFWQALDINYIDDDLVYVQIPMYMYHINRTHMSIDIVLFGSFEKNKWLLCQTPDANHAIEKLPSKDHDNSDGNISFDIY